jgi:hypothetical protein
MARFDKIVQVFRAKMEDAILAADANKVFGVSINSNGRVQVDSAAATDVVGVICPTRGMAAGEVIDVMTHGEIVEFTETDGDASTAGTKYYAAFATGLVSATATGSPKFVGETVEVGRLIVQVSMA